MRSRNGLSCAGPTPDAKDHVATRSLRAARTETALGRWPERAAQIARDASYRRDFIRRYAAVVGLAHPAARRLERRCADLS